MPFIVAGCAVLVVVILVLHAFLHVVTMHALAFEVGAAAGIPLLIFIVVAFLRGMTHHTVISVTEIEPPKPLPQLPAPAEIQPVPARVVRRLDPFTADGETWTEIVERAEREELLRSGPREARIVRFGGCEGPGCREALDDRPWTIEVDEDDGQVKNHSFCSRECAEQWQDHDYRERAGKSGVR